MSNRIKSLNFNDEVQDSVNWTIPTFNGSGSFIDKWNNFKPLLEEAKRAGKAIKNTDTLLTTFSAIHPYREDYSFHYNGGVLAPNGNLHFVPFSSFVGEKINIYTDQVSTYALIYTANYAYSGGVLASDGSIHFVPWDAPVGQKINPNGSVSTYSIPISGTAKFSGGTLSPDGNYIYFTPFNSGGGGPSTVGVKINVSNNQAITYNFTSTSYQGAVLTKEGLICFIPNNLLGGNLVLLNPSNDTWTTGASIGAGGRGGILDLDGNIHISPKSPYFSPTGYKFNTSTNLVTTYSIPSTALNYGIGGTLSPDGSIIFALEEPNGVGIKVYDDIVYTYSIPSGFQSMNSYFNSGAVLAPNGSIYFIPQASSTAYLTAGSYKINLATGVTFSMSVCLSPFYNKL